MGDGPLLSPDMMPAEMLKRVYGELESYYEGLVSSGNDWGWENYLRAQSDRLSSIFKSFYTPGNYSGKAVQAMYLLKYLDCYAFGYRDMYADFFRDYCEEVKSLDSDTLRILSIGCGNQVDAWGLNQSLKTVRQRKEYSGWQEVAHYAGVDLNPWENEFLMVPEAFTRADAGNFI